MSDTQYLPSVFYVKYHYDDGWSRGVEEIHIYAYDKLDAKQKIKQSNPNTKIRFIQVKKYG